MNLDLLSMPLEIDELASRQATLEARVSPDEMPRLSALGLEGITGRVVRFSPEPIRYRLEFQRDDCGAPRLCIGIRTTVILRCQRCLEPFEHRIDTRSHFQVARREEDMQADSGAFEALLCPEGRLMLQGMIEDEILLALPDVPRHEEGSRSKGGICRAPTLKSADPGASNAANSSRSPFAALDSLIEKR